MHPVVKLEIAHIEIGLIDMIMERVLFGLIHMVVEGNLRIEPAHSVEPFPKVRMIKGFSEIEITEISGRGLAAGQCRRRGEYNTYE
jgi:hypothetical protein